MDSDIFIIGDSHGNIEFLYHCAQLARQIGITKAVQVGDFGIWPNAEDFLDKINNIFQKANIHLYFIDGNHDWPDGYKYLQILDSGFGFVRPNISYIPRGHRWEWDGKHFGGLGGAFSVDWRQRTPGEDWWPGEEMPNNTDVEKLGTEKLDILFTHDRPVSASEPCAMSLALSDQNKSDYVRSLIDLAIKNTKPEILIHGHHHWRNNEKISWVNKELSDKTGNLEWYSTRIEAMGADITSIRDAIAVLNLEDLSLQDGNILFENNILKKQNNKPNTIEKNLIKYYRINKTMLQKDSLNVVGIHQLYSPY